jgi:ATP-dependent Clp protease adapter protein ClpS
VMSEAHVNGLALVTQEAQDVAERYCESMRASGLVATVEPAGPGGAA